MGIKLTFENAAFVDAIKKANILAPNSGAAFDKANGIVIDIDTEAKHGWTVLVRSTNLDLFRIEWIDPISVEGSGTARWRLPSRTFAPIVASLPISSGKTCTIEEFDADNGRPYVRLRSDRRNVRFNLIGTEYYPEWEIFDPSELADTQDLGGRIAQVKWAAAKTGEPMNGIHFTGTECIATNRYKIARAPIEIPGVTEPFTIPNGSLDQLLRQTGEVRVGVSSGKFGKQFLVMPDPSTQIRCITFGMQYPPYQGAIKWNKPNIIKTKKSLLTSLIEPARAYQAGERETQLTLIIGKQEIAVMSTHSEIGVFGDVIACDGDADHPRMQINFDPDYLLDAIASSPNDEVFLGYNKDNPHEIFLVNGGSGYGAWVAPRKTLKEGE